MTMKTSYKKKEDYKGQLLLQEEKASPPERSFLICLLRSTTFLPVPKTPEAHRLEMVKFPRRVPSPKKRLLAEGKM